MAIDIGPSQVLITWANVSNLLTENCDISVISNVSVSTSRLLGKATITSRLANEGSVSSNTTWAYRLLIDYILFTCHPRDFSIDWLECINRLFREDMSTCALASSSFCMLIYFTVQIYLCNILALLLSAICMALWYRHPFALASLKEHLTAQIDIDCREVLIQPFRSEQRAAVMFVMHAPSRAFACCVAQSRLTLFCETIVCRLIA